MLPTLIQRTYRFDVNGYPTILFFPAGSAEAESYDGGREIENFVPYINLKAGMGKDVAFLLSSEPSLSEYVNAFYHIMCVI